MANKRDRVAEVLRAIREFHALGCRSRVARPGRGPHGNGATEAEAKREGVNADHLRKARAFADPQTGYTRSELDALCRTVRVNFDTFDERGTRFGVAHVMRLLSVPKEDGERDEVQAELFAGGWSTAELDAEILRRYGRRRNGVGGSASAVGTSCSVSSKPSASRGDGGTP
jgi:hypothetical protein